MLQIKYSYLSEITLSKVADYLDEINTEGAGERWLIRFHHKISKCAQPIKYALCRHQIFAGNGFCCIQIDNWLVVFKIDGNIFYVHQIILASSLF